MELAKRYVGTAVVFAAAVTVACGSSSEEVDSDGASLVQAKSLKGLDEAETFRFQRGVEEFLEVDSAAEGLGPLFNGASCSHCHSLGGLGGGGLTRVVRAACIEKDGTPQDPPGGSLIHLFSTRPDIAVATLPECNKSISQRRSTALFGAGLLEAVADQFLEDLAASQSPELRGRVAKITDIDSGKQRIGRFGWKAQHASLRAFSGDAYVHELGVTNELFPEEVAPQGKTSLLEAMDPVPDPEATVGAIDRLADFMRFLAPPSASQTVPHFEEVGCSHCHLPSLPVEGALSSVSKSAAAYTDLLLHDIGTGDGIAQGAATGAEFRTAPLWGLRFAPNYLHDGRAATLEEAIEAHDKQAAQSRDAFFNLTPNEQAEMLTSLASL